MKVGIRAGADTSASASRECDEKGLKNARPAHETRKFERGRKERRRWEMSRETYVANEKLGAGVFEGNMTTI